MKRTSNYSKDSSYCRNEKYDKQIKRFHAKLSRRMQRTQSKLQIWSFDFGLLVSCTVIILTSDTNLLTFDLRPFRGAEPVLDLWPRCIFNNQLDPLQECTTAHMSIRQEASKRWMQPSRVRACMCVCATVNSEKGYSDVCWVCSLRLQMFTPGGLTLITFLFLQAL